MKNKTFLKVGTCCKLVLSGLNKNLVHQRIENLMFRSYDDAKSAATIIMMFDPQIQIDYHWLAYIFNEKNEWLYIASAENESKAKKLLFSIIPLCKVPYVEK